MWFIRTTCLCIFIIHICSFRHYFIHPLIFVHLTKSNNKWSYKKNSNLKEKKETKFKKHQIPKMSLLRIKLIRKWSIRSQQSNHLLHTLFVVADHRNAPSPSPHLTVHNEPMNSRQCRTKTTKTEKKSDQKWQLWSTRKKNKLL